MGTLHDRMQADIRIRRYSPCTEKAYLRCPLSNSRSAPALDFGQFKPPSRGNPTSA